MKRAKPRTTPAGTAKLAPRYIRPYTSGVTVRQGVESFLLARTDYRPSTRREHGDILARFADLAETAHWPSLAEMTNMQVRMWLADLNQSSARTGRPLSKARKNKCGAVARTFLRWAIAEGFADERLIHNVKWPPAYKLRHTFSTEFLRNGGNAYVLQVALGHTSPTVTSNYVHLVSADVEKAMQMFSPADALTKRRR